MTGRKPTPLADSRPAATAATGAPVPAPPFNANSHTKKIAKENCHGVLGEKIYWTERYDPP